MRYIKKVMRITITRQVIETIAIETPSGTIVAERDTVESVTITPAPRPAPFRAPLRDIGQTVLAQFATRR